MAATRRPGCAPLSPAASSSPPTLPLVLAVVDLEVVVVLVVGWQRWRQRQRQRQHEQERQQEAQTWLRGVSRPWRHVHYRQRRLVLHCSRPRHVLISKPPRCHATRTHARVSQGSYRESNRGSECRIFSPWASVSGVKQRRDVETSVFSEAWRPPHTPMRRIWHGARSLCTGAGGVRVLLRGWVRPADFWSLQRGW